MISYLFLGSFGLISLGLGSLLTSTEIASLATCLTQSSVSVILTLRKIRSADLSNGLGGRDVLDGEDGLDAGGVSLNLALGGEGLGGSSNVLGGGVELLVLAALAGEEDQAVLVLLETSNIGGKGLLRDVLAAVVDGDADCGSELAGNTSLLYSFVSFYWPIFKVCSILMWIINQLFLFQMKKMIDHQNKEF